MLFQILLLATWVILLAVTVVWTVIHSLEHMNIEADTSYQEHQQTSDSNGHLASYSGQEGQRSSSLTSANNALSFTVRKVFHVFIVLVYIPGLILDSRLLLLASTATFGLFIVLEVKTEFTFHEFYIFGFFSPLHSYKFCNSSKLWCFLYSLNGFSLVFSK